jgi:hypothetical protein
MFENFHLKEIFSYSRKTVFFGPISLNFLQEYKKTSIFGIALIAFEAFQISPGGSEENVWLFLKVLDFLRTSSTI